MFYIEIMIKYPPKIEQKALSNFLTFLHIKTIQPLHSVNFTPPCARLLFYTCGTIQLKNIFEITKNHTQH